MKRIAVRRSRAAAVAAFAAALAVGLLPPASAHASVTIATNHNLENHMSPEACQKTQKQSKFKFAIYYNSNFAGSYRNIGWPVWNFGHAPIGGAPQGGTQPLGFCRPGAGAGQGIKNNAASAENRHATYVGVVFYNSGYKGASDAIGWGRNLAKTRNQNASFKWR